MAPVGTAGSGLGGNAPSRVLPVRGAPRGAATPFVPPGGPAGLEE